MTERVLDRELEELRRKRTALEQQIDAAKKASGNAASAQRRVMDSARIAETLRERLAGDVPGELKRELVLLLVEPGSVVFHGDEVELNLLIPRRSNGVLVAGLADGPYPKATCESD